MIGEVTYHTMYRLIRHRFFGGVRWIYISHLCEWRFNNLLRAKNQDQLDAVIKPRLNIEQQKVLYITEYSILFSFFVFCLFLFWFFVLVFFILFCYFSFEETKRNFFKTFFAWNLLFNCRLTLANRYLISLIKRLKKQK